MGQQQSKDELLYQQVNCGNAERIKALCSDGAGLEWVDKEGKTPLIVACMKPEHYVVVKTLIELGANVNAYRPGSHGGTPLHHAAKRGLEETVKLLLSHGANALVMNDDCQSPLDVARVKGYGNVVRAIEGHICLFSGWLREYIGPSFLEKLAPQFLSKKVWVVVFPCGSLNLSKPFKLELAIYYSPQDAKPRTIIALWKANMEELKFNQAYPTVVISDISSKSWIKLAPANASDKEQLKWFCNACKGIPQVMNPSFPFHTQGPDVAGTAPPASEDLELVMAFNASLQSAIQKRPLALDTQPDFGPHASTSWTGPTDITNHNGSAALGPPSPPRKGCSSEWEVLGDVPNDNPVSVVQTTLESLTPVSAPSAPPIEHAVIDASPNHYPSIDSNPVHLSCPAVETLAATADDGACSSCVICLDAPVEGACIPCGHMAGCMTCLNEIKGKKWGCPVCRAEIDQVLRLYAV